MFGHYLSFYSNYISELILILEYVLHPINEYPQVGGIGTWAIYVQCGIIGDNIAANLFNDFIQPNRDINNIQEKNDTPSMDWYINVGDFLNTKTI